MSRTILCIDDETSILTSLKDQLQNELDDVEIELAQNGLDALDIIEELKEDDITLDLIISDYLMPGMNGDEFLIKAHLLSPKSKSIMLTGQAGIEGITRVINEAKLYRYISKPWEKNDLIMTVKEALESSENEKSLEFYKKNLEELVKEKHAENMTYLQIIDKYLIASKTDLNGVITEISQAMCDISGYTKEELIGKTHSIIRHPDMSNELFKDMWNTITNGKVWEGELRNLTKFGITYWVQTRVSPTFDKDKNIIGYASIRIDITERIKAEALAVTDDLTGLYNRRFFNENLNREISRAKRENKKLGFIILDIDYFKLYNDTYGHPKGDDSLLKVATAIKEQLKRASDYAFRLGGEEFGVLICDVTKEDFEQFILKIKKSIEDLKIMHKSSTGDFLTVSIGATICNCESIDIQKVYQEADNMLYEVKNNGRNSYLIKSL